MLSLELGVLFLDLLNLLQLPCILSVFLSLLLQDLFMLLLVPRLDLTPNNTNGDTVLAQAMHCVVESTLTFMVPILVTDITHNIALRP